MKNNIYDVEGDMRYLQLLSQTFPTVADASTEIINLQAILNLPKGTEHSLQICMVSINHSACIEECLR